VAVGTRGMGNEHMSRQLAVDGLAAQNVPMPEMHSFLTAQRPALARLWEVEESETRVAGALVEGSANGWSHPHWRRQLRTSGDFERQVDREQVLSKLMREGPATDAELMWLAGGIDAAAFPCLLSIRQVVRFAESLGERLSRARTDDEMLRVALLRRHAEGLAWRMIDWANRGQL